MAVFSASTLTPLVVINITKRVTKRTGAIVFSPVTFAYITKRVTKRTGAIVFSPFVVISDNQRTIKFNTGSSGSGLIIPDEFPTVYGYFS